nr:hypothetical protein BgiMline_031602 [Biomphalaria glabrata]
MASPDVEADAEPFQDFSPILCTFEKHKYLMSSELRKDNFEILIISHEDDDKHVRKFQQSLINNVTYCKLHELVSPKVELHRDLIYEDDSPTPELDFSLRKATVVFLYATHAFSECHWTVFEGRVSLGKVIKMGPGLKKVCVIHTKPVGNRDYSLPMTVDTSKDLYFSENEEDNQQFYDNVGRILQSTAHVQHQKDVELYKKRLEFFSQKYPWVLRLYRLGDERRPQDDGNLVRQGEASSRERERKNEPCPKMGRSLIFNSIVTTETSFEDSKRAIHCDTSATLANTDTQPDVEPDCLASNAASPISTLPNVGTRQNEKLQRNTPGTTSESSRHVAEEDQTTKLTNDLTELKIVDNHLSDTPMDDRSKVIGDNAQSSKVPTVFFNIHNNCQQIPRVSTFFFYVRSRNTHARNRNTHVRNRNTHVRNRNTHVRNRNTHARNRNTYVRNRNTHVRNWNTHLRNRNTHVRNRNTHVRNTQTHVKTGTLTPGTGTLTSGTGTLTSGTLTLTSETGTLTPGTGTLTTGTGTLTSGTLTLTSGTLTLTSGTGTLTSGTETLTSGTGTLTFTVLISSSKNKMAAVHVMTKSHGAESEPGNEQNGKEADLYKLDIWLKKNNFEILIIHNEEDDAEVRFFQLQLETNVSFLKRDEKVHPTVELYSEVLLESDKPFKDLELPLSKTLVVFLFITKSFCESGMTMFEGMAALFNSLEKDKRDTFVFVIHTKPKESRSKEYKLSPHFKAMTSLYFSKDGADNAVFFKNVAKILESKTSILYEKDEKLNMERQEFLEAIDGHATATTTTQKSPDVTVSVEKDNSKPKPVLEVKPMVHNTSSDPQVSSAAAADDDDDDFDMSELL